MTICVTSVPSIHETRPLECSVWRKHVRNTVNFTSRTLLRLTNIRLSRKPPTLNQRRLMILDAEELLLQAMTDRERLAELGKLTGMARYAQEGRDLHQLEDTERRMRHIGGRLPEKYRSDELIAAAVDPSERGAKIAQLYLERGFKLLDEEYADIPRIERAIRELQQ